MMKNWIRVLMVSLATGVVGAEADPPNIVLILADALRTLKDHFQKESSPDPVKASHFVFGQAALSRLEWLSHEDSAQAYACAGVRPLAQPSK